MCKSSTKKNKQMNIIKFTKTIFINGKKHRKKKERRETKQEKAMYLSLHDNIVHFFSFKSLCFSIMYIYRYICSLLLFKNKIIDVIHY